MDKPDTFSRLACQDGKDLLISLPAEKTSHVHTVTSCGADFILWLGLYARPPLEITRCRNEAAAFLHSDMIHSGLVSVFGSGVDR